MPTSPLNEKASLTTFTILTGGSEIPLSYEIMELNINQGINKISEAIIIVRDGDAAQQTFDVTDSETFKPGTEIEIKLGYEQQNDSAFKGLIIKQIIRIDDQGSVLEVICKDKALKSTINRKNNVFVDMMDSDIVTKIASGYGLDTSVTATTVTHKEMLQYYATDWDFMITRAEVNGMIIYTDSGKLVMAKPAVGDTPALQVTHGVDILEFDVQIDATNQYTGVQSNAWDMDSQSIINATASEPTINTQGDLSVSVLANVLSAGTNPLNSSVPIIQAEVQSWADAALLKSRLSRYRGTILFQGSLQATVNSTIKLLGLSERFNGNAYISGVTHSIVRGNWHTEVKIGLSSNWYQQVDESSAPSASGLLPGIRGLQTGIVTKINDDPGNEFRVQVKIPILGAECTEVWARLTTFYNGNTIGAFFMPEINNEVILGFMNDDPRFPIILGSVYSSSIAAPITPDEDNTIKTLITKSNLQLKFDDKNKVLTILTPGGNTIVLSDQDKGITITDQNSNSVKMNNEGIVVNSMSNLTLKAAEQVSIKGATIDVNGEESISMSSLMVSVTGDESISLNG